MKSQLQKSSLENVRRVNADRAVLEGQYIPRIKRAGDKWFDRILQGFIAADLMGQVAEGLRFVLTQTDSPESALFSLRLIIDGLVQEIVSDINPSHQELKEEIENSLIDSFSVGAENGLRDLGFIVKAETVDFELTDEMIYILLSERARSMSDVIIDTATQEAMDDVRKGFFLENQSPDDIIRSLEAKGFSEGRANRVASTEIQVGLGSGHYTMFERSGVPRKRWRTVNDNRVRTSHTKNQRQSWIPVNENFQNGSLHPGDGPPEEVVFCRCVLEPDLSNPEILLKPWTGGSSSFPLHESLLF